MRRFSLGVAVTVFLAPLLALAQTSCPQLTSNLSFGSRGSDVVHLQQYLISQNLLSPDSSTGYFGPLTEAAVQQWQAAHGIVSSGTPDSTGYGAVGPRTRAAIAGCGSSVSAVSTGSSSPVLELIQSLIEQVQALQARLAALNTQQSTTPDQTAEVSSTAAVTGTSASCSFNGQTIASGASVTAYFSPSAESACIAQLRTCVNGVLSGSYEYASCSLNSTPTILSTSASCPFGGQSIANGASATAYQDPAVAYGSQCVSEQRTCANGTLSGSYTNASCAAGSATSCFFDGQNITSGSSVTAYQSDAVSAGKSCKSQLRTCVNGVLSGTYVYDSCVVGAAASCLFNGSTIQSGASVTAYLSSSVTFGSCISQTRTCSNGTLSGTYQYNSCSVASAASCTFNGQTVQNGSSVTAYQASSVAYGSSCAESAAHVYRRDTLRVLFLR